LNIEKTNDHFRTDRVGGETKPVDLSRKPKQPMPPAGGGGAPGDEDDELRKAIELSK